MATRVNFFCHSVIRYLGIAILTNKLMKLYPVLMKLSQVLNNILLISQVALILYFYLYLTMLAVNDSQLKFLF